MIRVACITTAMIVEKFIHICTCLHEITVSKNLFISGTATIQDDFSSDGVRPDFYPVIHIRHTYL